MTKCVFVNEAGIEQFFFDLDEQNEAYLKKESALRGITVEQLINEILAENLPAKIEELMNAKLDAILEQRSAR